MASLHVGRVGCRVQRSSSYRKRTWLQAVAGFGRRGGTGDDHRKSRNGRSVIQARDAGLVDYVRNNFTDV